MTAGDFMSTIYICERLKETPKSETLISIKNEITEEELDLLNSYFDFTGDYHSITQILNIVIENGIEFKKWMDTKNLQNMRDKGVPPERLIMISNKLVLNYASSTKTFIDMMQRLLKNRKPECVETFLKLTNKFYDDNYEYRFWANFRNYGVHCSFPYSVFHEEEGFDCEVRCTREHLLKFNNWKHSRKDIEEMPEIVDLVLIVDEMSSFIYAFYLEFFYYICNEFISNYKGFCEFKKKYGVKSPIILKTEEPITKETDLAGSKFQPLPLREMNEIIKVMQKHPSIKINIIE